MSNEAPSSVHVPSSDALVSNSFLLLLVRHLLLVAMHLFLVASMFLVAMPFVPSSFLLLVDRLAKGPQYQWPKRWPPTYDGIEK